MNSIAIWWPEATESVSIHTDINLWLDRDPQQDYIEFGIKVGVSASIQEIYIFLPFKDIEGHVKDKINELIEGKLTKALFNEQMSVTQSDGGCHDVTYSTGDRVGESFRYCQLNEASDFSYDKITENDQGVAGTKLTIKLKKQKDNTQDYYRFRVNTSLDKLKTTSNENFFVIDGLVKEVSFVEFCINSSRKLPNSICDLLNPVQKIASMNLFIMTDILTTFEFESNKVKSTRMLEAHIWNSYLGKNLGGSRSKHFWDFLIKRKQVEKNVIANQWSESNFHDYNLFVKIKRSKKTGRALVGAVFLIIALGVAGNVATDLIYSSELKSQAITASQTAPEEKKESKNDAPNK